MAISSIRFGKNSIFLKDSDIRHSIQIIIEHQLARNGLYNAETAWMLSVFEKLVDDHENAPPGLRDIELDEILTDDNKIQLFKNLLHDTTLAIQKSSKADNKIISIITKIELLLKS